MKSVIDEAAAYLRERGVKNCKRQAMWLLSELLGVTQGELLFLPPSKLSGKELLWKKQLRLLGEGMPLDYIIGHTPFLQCNLHVTDAVLIPRPETEQLASMVISYLQTIDTSGKVLWDLCTGSGALGIAIKKYIPSLNVFLSDISPEALRIAGINCKRNEVEATLVEGDLLEPFSGMQADFIVCNPPYVAEHEYESLERGVKYEPKNALVGGEEGLDFYKRLALGIKKGCIWLEIGEGQGEAVQKIFGGGVVKNDFSGRQRFFFLEKE